MTAVPNPILKKCPTCKGVPIVCHTDSGWVWVRCQNKNCSEQYETPAKNNERMAIFAWNGYVTKAETTRRIL
jgi:hypothetical protein